MYFIRFSFMSITNEVYWFIRWWCFETANKNSNKVAVGVARWLGPLKVAPHSTESGNCTTSRLGDRTQYGLSSVPSLALLMWAVGRGGREGPCPPWIFIHDTDKVEGGLMVLFFNLVFFRCLPGNSSADASGVARMLGLCDVFPYPSVGVSTNTTTSSLMLR